MSAYGDLGDPASALWIFLNFFCRSTRTWNVLLGALAKSAECRGNEVLDPYASSASTTFPVRKLVNMSQKTISTLLRRANVLEVIEIILGAMSKRVIVEGLDAPPPNSQTYCIATSALQYADIDSTKALNMFRNATVQGIPPDGRFLNAIFRCYGENIDAALNDWKNEIRPRYVAYESRSQQSSSRRRQKRGDNLAAAYDGLFYVCGRSLRPDIALRLVYTMSKEGLETTENSLNSYKSGKRIRNTTGGPAARIAQKLKLSAYESLLEVECSKYDQNDRRRQGEQRVRIIV